MKISDYLSVENIKLDVKPDSKDQIIKNLVGVLSKNDPNMDVEEAFDDLWEREEDYSTGLGDGIAFPHARTSGILEHKLAFGICHEGTDFDSRDKQPVYFIPLLLTPRSSGKPHILILANIIKKLENADIRQRLLATTLAEDIVAILDEDID